MSGGEIIATKAAKDWKGGVTIGCNDVNNFSLLKLLGSADNLINLQSFFFKHWTYAI